MIISQKKGFLTLSLILLIMVISILSIGLEMTKNNLKSFNKTITYDERYIFEEELLSKIEKRVNNEVILYKDFDSFITYLKINSLYTIKEEKCDLKFTGMYTTLDSIVFYTFELTYYELLPTKHSVRAYNNNGRIKFVLCGI